jgi:NitT/TauT family transport system substrate-binding protein
METAGIMRSPGMTARVVGATLLALALVAFGSASSVAQTAEVTLRVGVIPISDVAPLYLGIAKGYFKDERLTIVPVPAQGGAAIIPAVLSGDEEIGFSNSVSLILASARGLPIQVVANGSQVIADGHHTSAAVMVAGAGPVQTLKDLEGKTIAVNSLNNIGDITIKDVLAKHGVDATKVKFIELGFPEMPVALKEGRVDAIWANEPFLSVAKADGARMLFNNYEDYDPTLTVAMYFTTLAFAHTHADVVARFMRAMNRSLRFAASHTVEARAVLATYTKLDDTSAAQMGLIGWSTSISLPSLEHLQASLIANGLLTRTIDLQALVPPSALSGK